MHCLLSVHTVTILANHIIATVKINLAEITDITTRTNAPEISTTERFVKKP